MARSPDSLDLSTFETRELLLQKLRLRLVNELDPRFGATLRNSLAIDEYEDMVTRRMFRELNAYILAEKLVDKTVTKEAYHRVDVHATWWEHFKDAVLDRYRLTRWYVRWRPVRFNPIVYTETLTANFKQFATFPAADIQTPDSVHHYLIVPKEELTYS